MSRWRRLWIAVVEWWRNAPKPAPPSQVFLEDARKMLADYDELYCQRVGISALMSAQAAEIVSQEGHKRAPGLDNEVRTLAIVVERTLGYLELELEVKKGTIK